MSYRGNRLVEETSFGGETSGYPEDLGTGIGLGLVLKFFAVFPLVKSDTLPIFRQSKDAKNVIHCLSSFTSTKQTVKQSHYTIKTMAHKPQRYARNCALNINIMQS